MSNKMLQSSLETVSWEKQKMTPVVFVSYAHKDEDWKERLFKHLKFFEEKCQLEIWDDRRIQAGEEWFSEICKAIDSAHIAIFLVSGDLLISKFINKEEVPRILSRRTKEGLTIIPILVSPCLWKQEEWLKRLQLRPKDGKPLTTMPKQKAETLLVDIAEEIYLIAKEKYSFIDSKYSEKSVATKGKLPESSRLIEININRDFDDFSDEDSERVSDAVKTLLKCRDIEIRIISRGSVKIVFEIPEEYANLFLELVENGALSELGVTDAKEVFSDAPQQYKTHKLSHSSITADALSTLPTDTPQEIEVYSYIRSLAHLSSEQCIDLFYRLLWNRDIPVNSAIDSGVLKSLNAIVMSDGFIGERGIQFINRCYYTILNLWHLQADRSPADLKSLIGKLDEIEEENIISRETRLLRRKFYEFRNSPYAECLRRQICIVSAGNFSQAHEGILEDYLSDYFYLYCSTTHTSDIEALERTYENGNLQSGIRHRQFFKIQENYEKLQEYQQQKQLGVVNLENPTKLPLGELEEGIRIYNPKRFNSASRKAKVFQENISTEQDLRWQISFIQNYCREPLRSLPARTQQKLSRDFSRVLNTSDTGSRMTSTSLIIVFQRLLDSLLLSQNSTSDILLFRHNIDHSGPIAMTDIIITIVAGCPMIRFYLERKLGCIYQYFEHSKIEAVNWLINFFEHINLGLTLNAKNLGYLP